MPSPAPPAEHHLKASLPSNLTEYLTFIQAVLDQLTVLGWSQRDLFAINMALEESISNAIRHGNKQDPGKRVHVECRLSGTRFWTQITDEGPGFNPSAVPDCCAPDRLEVPGGRGLALMHAFMTRMEYNDRGNSLTMEKLQGDAASNGCDCP